MRRSRIWRVCSTTSRRCAGGCVVHLHAEDQAGAAAQIEPQLHGRAHDREGAGQHDREQRTGFVRMSVAIHRTPPVGKRWRGRQLRSGAALFPGEQNRAGDEDRRERAHHDPDHQGQRESMQHRPANSNSESAVSSVSPEVRIVRLRVWLMLRLIVSASGSRPLRAAILPDAIEHHDGVVHGIADQREQGGHHRERDLLMEQREQADGDERRRAPWPPPRPRHTPCGIAMPGTGACRPKRPPSPSAPDGAGRRRSAGRSLRSREWNIACPTVDSAWSIVWRSAVRSSFAGDFRRDENFVGPGQVVRRHHGDAAQPRRDRGPNALDGRRPSQRTSITAPPRKSMLYRGPPFIEQTDESGAK